VFFDDVNAQFDIDISDRFCWEKMYTVADLLTFLDQQIRPYAESKQNSSNSI
jgi:acyl carrier protein